MLFIGPIYFVHWFRNVKRKCWVKLLTLQVYYEVSIKAVNIFSCLYVYTVVFTKFLRAYNLSLHTITTSSLIFVEQFLGIIKNVNDL